MISAFITCLWNGLQSKAAISCFQEEMGRVQRKCFGLKEHAKVNKQSFDVELSKQYEKMRRKSVMIHNW